MPWVWRPMGPPQEAQECPLVMRREVHLWKHKSARWLLERFSSGNETEECPRGSWNHGAKFCLSAFWLYVETPLAWVGKFDFEIKSHVIRCNARVAFASDNTSQMADPSAVGTVAGEQTYFLPLLCMLWLEALGNFCQKKLRRQGNSEPQKSRPAEMMY